MFRKKIKITSDTGLHARPASDLTILAQEYESDISIIHNDNTINAKSIVEILMGGISKGSEIDLIVEGSDEDVAFAKLSEYLENLPN